MGEKTDRIRRPERSPCLVMFARVALHVLEWEGCARELRPSCTPPSRESSKTFDTTSSTTTPSKRRPRCVVYLLQQRQCRPTRKCPRARQDKDRSPIVNKPARLSALPLPSDLLPALPTTTHTLLNQLIPHLKELRMRQPQVCRRVRLVQRMGHIL